MESWEAVSCDQCEYKNLIKFIMRYHDSSHHGQTCGEVGRLSGLGGSVNNHRLVSSAIFMIQYQGWIFASFLSSLYHSSVGFLSLLKSSRGAKKQTFQIV